ncbi:MAG: hypothetical protein R3A10_13425 [Caldilineaceae bacterium]
MPGFQGQAEMPSISVRACQRVDGGLEIADVGVAIGIHLVVNTRDRLLDAAILLAEQPIFFILAAGSSCRRAAGRTRRLPAYAKDHHEDQLWFVYANMCHTGTPDDEQNHADKVICAVRSAKARGRKVEKVDLRGIPDATRRPDVAV